MNFPPKSLFHSRATLPRSKRGRLQSYFKISYSPFPKPVQLSPFLTPFHSLFQSVMPLSTLSILQTHLLYHHHHAAFPDFLRKLLPLLPLGFPDSWVGSNCLCHSWLLSMTLEQIALSYKCTTINFLRAEMKSHAQISSTGPQTWGNSINIW